MEDNIKEVKNENIQDSSKTGLADVIENISKADLTEKTQEVSKGLQPGDEAGIQLTSPEAAETAGKAAKPAKNAKKVKAAGKPAAKKKKGGRRKGSKNQKGLLTFILVGLACIVVASIWIISNHKAEQQAAAVSKAAADIIAQGTEAVGNVEIPEVRTRENVSNNYHVISHRGYPAKAEESSFEGYDLALDAGTMYIEQDIVTSADGTLYVSHDDSPQRLTGTGGKFADMTDAEIDELTTHGGNKILKLSDVFDRYGKTVGYVIELRDKKEATVNAFTALMDKYKMADNVILQSFEADVLEALEEKYPDMPKMYLCRTPDDRSRGIGLDCVDIVCINKTYMNEFGANAVHNAGKKFGVWTIDAENHIMEAIRIGADYYFTDDTGKALDLEKRYRND